MRFKKGEKEEIQRLNKNANAKMKRLQSKFKNIELPDTKPIADIKDMTRKQLNTYKENVRQFNKRQHQYVENEKGLVLPKSLVRKIEKAEKEVNRQKRKERERMENTPLTLRGKATGLTVGEQKHLMKDRRMSQFNDVKFDWKKVSTPRELEKLLDRVEKNEGVDVVKRQKETLRNNYLIALEHVFGFNDAEKLYSKIKNMDLDKFSDMHQRETLRNIGFIYDKVERQLKLKVLEEMWGA